MPNLSPTEERSQSIQRICAERKIEHLVHFTPMRNLAGILRHGLLSRAQFRTLPESLRPQVNDEQRFDGQPNYISLSISFPNYKLFFKFRGRLPEPWVVILYKPCIMWELDCLFCHSNAASGSVARTPLDVRREPQALTQMFKDQGPRVRTQLGIPDHFPTNPQAEVLVRNHIATFRIASVVFQSDKNKRDWMNNLSTSPTIEVVVDEEYFKPRVDSGHWTSSESHPISADHQVQANN